MEKYFRGKKLIDREEEIKFLLDWFTRLPELILWIYGPKSCGKTTLIEYVVEKELFEDFEKLEPRGNYWVKYLNLRRKLISSYETFLEAFIKPKSNKKQEKLSARISVGIFEIKREILNEVKKKKKDLFDIWLNELENLTKENKKPILIIDEIQRLEEIYINGGRELLKDFLNFCVALTKETHISHVVILSSNTIFMDRIYNDAKLKLTSEFYKIGHLDKDIVIEWLSSEGFKEGEIEVIWDYLGGCIPLIQKIIILKDRHGSLKEYLEHQAFLAYTQIVDFLARENTEEEEKIFREIAKIILKEGKFVIKDDLPNKHNYLKVIDKWAEKEILFFDPQLLEVTGNSRIYEKGMERLL